jgi:hypothetical protein
MGQNGAKCCPGSERAGRADPAVFYTYRAALTRTIWPRAALALIGLIVASSIAACRG